MPATGDHSLVQYPQILCLPLGIQRARLGRLRACSLRRLSARSSSTWAHNDASRPSHVHLEQNQPAYGRRCLLEWSIGRQLDMHSPIASQPVDKRNEYPLQHRILAGKGVSSVERLTVIQHPSVGTDRRARGRDRARSMARSRPRGCCGCA